MPTENPLETLTLDELRQRQSVKWRVHGDDVLPLWIAEMDVPLAEPVRRTIVDAATRGDTGYALGEPYAQALREFAAERWSWPGIDVSRTRLVPDVMLGATEVLRQITAPGGTVVVNSPVYPPFYAFVTNMGRRVVEAPLTGQGRIDFDALADTFDAGADAYLLCNPHNPTGTVHTRPELEQVTALAERHAVRVVADEIHAPLVLPGAEFTPYLSLPGAARAFSLMSASKGWNLAGLKAAIAVAGADAAEELAQIPEEVSHGPSHLGVLAHTAALQHGGEWLDAVLTGLDNNRTLLTRLLREKLPDVGWTPPEGTYLAWLDVTALSLGDTTNTDPAAAFLEHGNLALSSGLEFGSGGAGHVRLNFATSAARLTEAVRRMATFADDTDTADTAGAEVDAQPR